MDQEQLQKVKEHLIEEKNYLIDLLKPLEEYEKSTGKFNLQNSHNKIHKSINDILIIIQYL